MSNKGYYKPVAARQKTCPCGKVFSTRHGCRIYCDNKTCEASPNRIKANFPSPTTCHCGKEFQAMRHGHLFCSLQCKNEARKARERGGVCICKTCLGQFDTTHKKKYCSDVCNPHIKLWDKSPRACTTCGSQYNPSFNKQKVCSRKCQRYGNGGRDKYYQTKEWKLIKASFKTSFTTVNGLLISNQYCIECYRKQNRVNDMYAVDHITPRRLGGTDDHSNLQSLCKHHHQSKSAQEGNANPSRNRGGRPRVEGGVNPSKKHCVPRVLADFAQVSKSNLDYGG